MCFLKKHGMTDRKEERGRGKENENGRENKGCTRGHVMCTSRSRPFVSYHMTMSLPDSERKQTLSFLSTSQLFIFIGNAL